MTLDTVFGETPARVATSLTVERTRLPPPGPQAVGTETSDPGGPRAVFTGRPQARTGTSTTRPYAGRVPLTELVSALPAAGPLAMLGPDWLDPDKLINSFTQSFGVWAILAIAVVVFIETGLLFPILPGDSLLFTAGALVAQRNLDFPLWMLCVVMFLAAFLGDQVGYLIGRTAGPKVFRRPDSRIFKQKYI